MNRASLLIGAFVLATPANAALYLGTLDGTVNEKFATAFTSPSSDSPIRVGDRVSVRFEWSGLDGASLQPGQIVPMWQPNRAEFQIGNLVWTSAGDFLGGHPAPGLLIGDDPMRNYYSTMDDAVGTGDLRVRAYSFEISDFGYEPYFGPGFRGAFDRQSFKLYEDGALLNPQDGRPQSVASAVPEPATWAFLLCGFGMAGLVLRTRRARKVAGALSVEG